MLLLPSPIAGNLTIYVAATNRKRGPRFRMPQSTSRFASVPDITSRLTSSRPPSSKGGGTPWFLICSISFKNHILLFNRSLNVQIMIVLTGDDNLTCTMSGLLNQANVNTIIMNYSWVLKKICFLVVPKLVLPGRFCEAVTILNCCSSQWSFQVQPSEDGKTGDLLTKKNPISV